MLGTIYELSDINTNSNDQLVSLTLKLHALAKYFVVVVVRLVKLLALV